MVKVKAGAKVITIEPAQNVLTIERVVELFSTAFEQNLNGGFIYNLGKFLEWLRGKLGEYKERFSHSRFHRGVKAHSADLYKCNVRKLI
jgi:hypothetical protein